MLSRRYFNSFFSKEKEVREEMSSFSSPSISSPSMGSLPRRDASLVPFRRSLLDKAGVSRSSERMGKTRARAKVDARGVTSPSSPSFKSSLNRDVLSHST